MFLEDPEAGANKLFNVLKAYSQYDDGVGYMQGMNFLAGLVLTVFDDEALAFFVFKRVLEVNEWRRMFVEGTPKLFELSEQVKAFIKKEMCTLHKRMKVFEICIEPLLASAFLTVFSNLLVINEAQKALERFILEGEVFVVETIKGLLKVYEEKMINMDSWELMLFIAREMYQ